MEKRLLSVALKDRSSYEEIFSRILPESLSPIGQASAQLIQEFYDTDPTCRWAEKTTLIERARTKFVNPKQSDAVAEYISSLSEEVSVPNLLRDIRAFKRNRLGDQVALSIANREEPNKILELMTQYQDLGHDKQDDDEQVYRNFSVAELVKTSFQPTSQIRLLPKELNDKLDGGARPGHHILVYARPEIGKTLFVINLIAGFLSQKLPVLYIGNEDPVSDILIRIVGRLARWTKQQVKEEPDKAHEIAVSKGYDNLIVASLSPGNFFEVRKLVEKYKPKVVILDQLRNFEVYSESRVQALEKAATEARNVAKRYSVVVVSVTQAGESAEGKAVLGRDDIDFSKTGIPAQVDLMIGIGADDNMEKHGMRTISLPKNKLSGDHSVFSVAINPQLGTVENTA